MHGLEYSITMKIPAMSAVFLKPVNKRSPESDKPKPEKAEKPAKPQRKRLKHRYRKRHRKPPQSPELPQRTCGKESKYGDRKKNGKAKK